MMIVKVKMKVSLIVMKTDRKMKRREARKKKFQTMNSFPDQEYENKLGHLSHLHQLALNPFFL